MKLSNPLKLIIAIIISEMAGVIGSLFTYQSIPTWYANLAKPAVNPPNWIFAPVWTMLFVLMGIAAFLVWKRGLDKKEVRLALLIFIGQLILNSLWSIIFFGLHNPAAAFFEIIILWLAILATIITFSRISKAAVFLLLPYILWVTFAGYLNFSIWRLSLALLAPIGGGSVCTLEAKICPDGSTVGRTGKNCQFAPCPNSNATGTENIPSDWKTFSDKRAGISFSYPNKLSTVYTFAVNWPPKAAVSSGPFTCEETEATSSLPVRVMKKSVDNRLYCVKAASEGAAGSVYTDYTYTTEKDNKLISLSFTLRAVQCGNYDEPQKTACSNERETFDLDSVIDKVARSLKFVSK